MTYNFSNRYTLIIYRLYIYYFRRLFNSLFFIFTLFFCFLECEEACNVRCSQKGHKKRCLFYCNHCCGWCQCVPPGYVGENKDCCPCYRDWKKQTGEPKCP